MSKDLHNIGKLYGFDLFINLEKKHGEMEDWEKEMVIARINTEIEGTGSKFNIEK